MPPVHPETPFLNSFIRLSDTPQSYAGNAGKVAAVNAAENALEFIAAGGGADTGNAHQTVLPWNYNLAPWGTWGFEDVHAAFGLSPMFGKCFGNAPPMGAGANGDEIQWKIFLLTGAVYTLNILACTAPDCGIALVNIQELGMGLYAPDFYSAIPAADVSFPLAGFGVPASGLYTLDFLLNGKNAGSTAYSVYLNSIAIWRTA
jgi:hypothetical protein